MQQTALSPNTEIWNVQRRPLDLEDYISMVRRNTGWVLGPVLAGLTIAAVTASVWPSTFVSTAVIRVVPPQVPEKIIATNVATRMEEQRTHLQLSKQRLDLALKAARGTLDSDTVRIEGDRLMSELGSRLNAWRAGFEERVTGTLGLYFDPKGGLFMDRVDRLTKSDGELSTLMRQQVVDAQGHLTRLFEGFVGENSALVKMLDPTGDNQLIEVLRTTLDRVVIEQNAAMSRHFSLDNKDGALCPFLAELEAKHGNTTPRWDAT